MSLATFLRARRASKKTICEQKCTAKLCTKMSYKRFVTLDFLSLKCRLPTFHRFLIFQEDYKEHIKSVLCRTNNIMYICTHFVRYLLSSTRGKARACINYPHSLLYFV